ncbi:DUF5701 family protein [Nocardiopsis ansamitocini]|uniref:Uncharacterized protein n=1 Tax=Nocardiopsis ansamitocini TaxID=1670832 RepID=A0A9W6P6V3_9ACTN|nr:DUF5701 family protein [Nocardiopsis ansamitocini]GLU48554.1 hypothetical protein Nans01_29050 [Nocardiopsis ansamitocini]
MPPTPTAGTTPTGIAGQIDRLVELGLPALAGMTVEEFHALARDLPAEAPGAIVAVHPGLVPASALAPLLSRGDKSGFVVVDMADLDAFAPIDGLDAPEDALYLINEVDRGDDMANWSPDEALPEISSRGRRPLTIGEGISWLLQEPERLAPNHCFMTIGSRKRRKGTALDSRTPAIWISGGTGRDGRDNRGAPKVGWCWAGNRHTWLGFASAAAQPPA